MKAWYLRKQSVPSTVASGGADGVVRVWGALKETLDVGGRHRLDEILVLSNVVGPDRPPPAYSPATSIRKRQWSLAPHSSTEFMARTVTPL